MTEALIILDEYFNIIFFNDATLQLLECEEIDIKNRSFLTLFTDFYSSNQWLRTNVAKHIYKSYETSLTKKGNRNVTVLLSSSVIVKQGAITGVVCIASDITLQKQAEQKIRENYDKLKELDNLKENFISMVSHELRTPLTSIKGFIALLLGNAAGQTTPDQKEFLEIVQNNSDRLLLLINEILDISKMSSGGFSIQKSGFDLVKILDSSIRDMSSIIARKKITIIKETPFSGLKMQVDEYRFSQAIINLLNNAIKFSPQASKITVRLEEYSGEKFSLPAEIKSSMAENIKYVILSIADEGVGLTPEQKLKVFERFYQAEDAITRKTPGTGLGLYITKNIVELHGGFIWVESKGHNEGTIFYILLPME
jgi:PAS domain S-box-containing protein